MEDSRGSYICGPAPVPMAVMWIFSCLRGSYVYMFLFLWELRGPVPDGSYVDLLLFPWKLRGTAAIPVGAMLTCSCSWRELRGSLPGECKIEAAQQESSVRSHLPKCPDKPGRHLEGCVLYIPAPMCRDKPCHTWRAVCLLFLHLCARTSPLTT